MMFLHRMTRSDQMAQTKRLGRAFHSTNMLFGVSGLLLVLLALALIFMI